MMQNGVAVPGRSKLIALAPRLVRADDAAAVLHRFELWTLLESHAVAVAAHAPDRDLERVRGVFPQLNRELTAPGDSDEWQRLEVRVHRAITAQSGNPLLADTVERLCPNLQPLKPRAGTLWLLQCQHRKVLSCIEAGQADAAVLHTRVHLRLLRDQLLAAITRTGTCGTRP